VVADEILGGVTCHVCARPELLVPVAPDAYCATELQMGDWKRCYNTHVDGITLMHLVYPLDHGRLPDLFAGSSPTLQKPTLKDLPDIGRNRAVLKIIVPRGSGSTCPNRVTALAV
jgi:hypothetical protein